MRGAEAVPVGGVGGFLLPALLGTMKQATGSFGPGFAVLALAAGGALILLQALVSYRAAWSLSSRAGLPADAARFEESGRRQEKSRELAADGILEY